MGMTMPYRERGVVSGARVSCTESPWRTVGALRSGGRRFYRSCNWAETWCSEPVGTSPLGPWVLPTPVIHRRGPAPSKAICQHRLPSGHPPRPPMPPGALPRPVLQGWTPPAAFRPPPARTAAGHPFLLTPGGLPQPQGLLDQSLGPRDQPGGPSAPAPCPLPSPPPDHILPAAPCLFHQAKDCFLNKSKKLHFLLGKFILSHFISFPPIFFPNNVIK